MHQLNKNIYEAVLHIFLPQSCNFSGTRGTHVVSITDTASGSLAMNLVSQSPYINNYCAIRAFAAFCLSKLIIMEVQNEHTTTLTLAFKYQRWFIQKTQKHVAVTSRHESKDNLIYKQSGWQFVTFFPPARENDISFSSLYCNTFGRFWGLFFHCLLGFVHQISIYWDIKGKWNRTWAETERGSLFMRFPSTNQTLKNKLGNSFVRESKH